MKGTKKYWKGLEQLENSKEFQERAGKEFPEYLPVLNGESGNGDATRRDFLKLMGFSVAAVSLAACETPVKKAIPYVRKPETVDPSVPNYYASTYVSGSDVSSVVVKTREGRPIKIEKNDLSSLSKGTSAQIEASVLSLYDEQRFKGPQVDGAEASWDDVDTKVKGALSSGKTVLVSNSISSPSTLAAIAKLQDSADLDVVAYDQISSAGTLDAYEETFGQRSVPNYDFTKAKTIVSFGFDFLGTGGNNTLWNNQFAQTRKVSDKKKEMSRLYAFESNLSLTGANADYRQPIKPSQEGEYIKALYNAVAAKTGQSKVSGGNVEDAATVKMAASDLLKTKGAGVVLSGSNDKNVQLLVIAINQLLENYGGALTTSVSVNTVKGDDKAFAKFVKDLNAGKVANVIFYNCNPVYDHVLGSEIAAGISKAKLSVSTSDRADETTTLVGVIAPDTHYLEAWNDFEPVSGFFSLSQPTISKIFDSRQAQDSFLTWANVNQSYYDFLRGNWEAGAFASSGASDFEYFWNKTIQDGVLEGKSNSTELSGNVDADAAAAGIKSSSSDLELVLYQKAGVSNGIQANNPWLQEMPDPITKATWDNYLTISPKQAAELGVKVDSGEMTTNIVTLTVGGQSVDVPVVPQPGQAYGTLGLAVGYGRTNAGKVADGVGVNAYPLFSKGTYFSTAVTSGVSVGEPSGEYRIGQTQTSQTYMGRETVVQETTLAEYKKDSTAGQDKVMLATADGKKSPLSISLWKGHEYPNHHWGMAIDLNSCTGCGSCTISCQSENNIPVVGKEEVLNRREMHWLRIDRYYSHSEAADEMSGRDQLLEMENASENPEVTFQPMMCQQCNNAPCETVCPVAATTHSTEGLNQMAYNRCIGTRYCANNCPYKVRRFNWFKYHDNEKFAKNTAMNNDLGKMVLNPDVTVRSRGVMEKCSFCVQRIQSGKLEAKKEGRRPVDGEITTACASACPSEAIVFGDMKDPDSKISKYLQIEQKEKMVEAKEPRAYHVLEELRVMPNVWYMTKVRNKDNSKAEG